MRATSPPRRTAGGGLVASTEGVGMTGRGWTAALLLFAVLFVHGLQCGSAADGAAHLGADPMVSLGATAAAADEADRADATAPHASPLAAALAHGADQMPAGAVLSSEHG